MKLEAKIENPITLKLSEEKKVLVLENEELSLEMGSMFGDAHYGFNLEANGKMKSYATQCRIVGVQFVEGNLRIYEDHKYIPWRFTQDGFLVNRAIFSNLKRNETEYLRKEYGVVDQDGLDEINEYRIR